MKNFFRKNILLSIASIFLATVSFPLFSAEKSTEGKSDIWKELTKSFSEGSIPPEKETLEVIRKALPAWGANSSALYTAKSYNGPPAWRLILNRPTGRKAARETSIHNAFILIYMIQARAGVTPAELKKNLNWDLPESELELYTVFLGKAKGYYWFVKGDLFYVNVLHNSFKFTGGENFRKIMAYALNVNDFDHYTARTALLYFKDRKDDSPHYIMQALEEWKEEKKDPPYQHLEAMKLCGGKIAGKVLTQIALSRDKGLARKAIDYLLESPELAEEKFLRRLLYLPEYTEIVLRIFARQKKIQILLPDLEKIINKPRSIIQYALCVEAHRKISRKIATVPEISSASHIRLRMVRLGDTKDSNKFIPMDESGTGAMTEKVERRRIKPFMDIILRSQDPEAAVAAALLLASLDQGNERFLTKEYLERVHKIGIELLQTLPPEHVKRIMERLYDSIKQPGSRIVFEKIAKEIGIRQ